jgi:hypothetical protein
MQIQYEDEEKQSLIGLSEIQDIPVEQKTQ